MAEAEGRVPLDLLVRPSTVQGQAVEKLRQAIIAGVFKPGDRLVEARLCKMLGVSRPSVREALRSLEAQHLIAIVPNRGTQIPFISWQEARDIYHVRALLEGDAAALCATRASAEDVAAMRSALDDFAVAVQKGDRAGLLKDTARFYAVILRSCGNAVIADMLVGLLARISFLRDRSMSRTGRSALSLAEMRAICDAIESGDEAAARAAAILHVQMASEAARETYEDDAATPAMSTPRRSGT
ncbi:DNA-binding GntR family transcriptional regulator [Rhodoligotrophos appendicifer]|uniref:GntR family transcriptional regulator n=1 Tax=Rhodoligotrophos appendicifer TaxID=987056 RepID=UPI00117C9833|nr:GntR family transcriptional regulator [Rhodoligotrophos appendicifer]